MRVFVALWPDAPVKRALSDVQRAWNDAISSAGGQLVAPENLHLTLAFLGDQPPGFCTALAKALAARSWDTVSLSIHALGYWSQPRALVALPETLLPQLARLRAGVLEVLAGLGWSDRAEEPFVPHVTLARNLAAPPKRLGTLPAFAAALTPIAWQTNAPLLVCSERAGQTIVYTPLVHPARA